MEEHQQVQPPEDLSQACIVTRYELLKHLRSKRLWGILIIEAIILVLILAVPPLAGSDYSSNPADFAQDFFGWTKILIIIGATLFAGDTLVSEFQNRTGYLIFPNPVKRITYFTGKFAATMLIMIMMLVIYYGVTSIFSLAITGGVSSLTLNSFALALLFALAASGVGYLISSFMKGGTGALVFTFALLFLIMPIVDRVLTFAKVKPEFSLTFIGDSIQYIMESPYPQDFVRDFPMGGGTTLEITNYYPDPSLAVIGMITYAVVTICIAIWLFNRREMAT